MKKIILSLGLLLILLLPQYSYALEGLDINTKSGTKSAHETKDTIKNRGENLQDKRFATRSANSENQLSNLKQRADKEIDRRIKALNKLLSRLDEMKKLSDSGKSSLKTQIQANIDSLSALKIKIDADTNLDTLKTDVKSIIGNYYIFAFFIEYIHLNAAFDRATATVSNMTIIHDKLQTKITEAEGNGKDVTSLKTQLTDMQNKLDDAKSIITTAQSDLAGLSASGYPANKTKLGEARKKLQTVYQDLKAAHQDAKQIVRGLGIDFHDKDSKEPTQTPTNTPTPTPI